MNTVLFVNETIGFSENLFLVKYIFSCECDVHTIPSRLNDMIRPKIELLIHQALTRTEY